MHCCFPSGTPYMFMVALIVFAVLYEVDSFQFLVSNHRMGTWESARGQPCFDHRMIACVRTVEDDQEIQMTSHTHQCIQSLTTMM